MLRAFLGTLLIVFILVFYFLPKQKNQALLSPSKITNQTKETVNQPVISQAENLESESNPSQQATVSKNIHSNKLQRRISSEELMDEFYKDTNNEKILKNKLEQEFLQKHARVGSDYYFKDQEEKWSVFHGVYITLDKDTESLMGFGPYKVTTLQKPDMPLGRLIYNEDKKDFAILTGRLIAKLKNLFDEERISKDYDFKIDSVNVDIKTVYFKPKHEMSLASIRKLLNSDTRIDSFYFETVHNQWQKN